MDPSTWLDEHGSVLYAYAMRRVGDPGIAEDQLQETLLTALDRAETFAGRSTVRTWLTGILRYKILQHFESTRRAGGRVTDLDAGTTDDLFTRIGRWRDEPRPWPDDAGGSDDFRRVLEACLEALPARSAEAFLLSERHDLPAENLGQILGVTTTHVYVMLYRARSALRECLERCGVGA